ncbi:hypothetical protein RRG08_062926 [Elysia crispata]|uniref:Uncharacterized protein n=1 Tax=Elysia crispata TaxID=231223 RepID=A0AAE1D3J4_9GAST|nr:hypothetical protein RRG08_062926 [Elysia crispata]
MKNINHTHNRTSHAPINTHSNPPTQPTHKRGQLDWNSLTGTDFLRQEKKNMTLGDLPSDLCGVTLVYAQASHSLSAQVAGTTSHQRPSAHACPSLTLGLGRGDPTVRRSRHRLSLASQYTRMPLTHFVGRSPQPTHALVPVPPLTSVQGHAHTSHSTQTRGWNHC